jgi:hypothetical protein
MKAWDLGYNKAFSKAKGIYKSIGNIKCPALNNEYVYFSRVGLNHLVRKGRIPRTRNEQKRRFRLIPYIKKVIKNEQAVIEYRKQEKLIKINRHGQKITRESIAHFWTFKEKIKDCNIKIVIRQIDEGNKSFFSVMGDNVKTT